MVKCVGTDDNIKIFECLECGKRMLEEGDMCKSCWEALKREEQNYGLKEEWLEERGDLNED